MWRICAKRVTGPNSRGRQRECWRRRGAPLTAMSLEIIKTHYESLIIIITTLSRGCWEWANTKAQGKDESKFRATPKTLQGTGVWWRQKSCGKCVAFTCRMRRKRQMKKKKLWSREDDVIERMSTKGKIEEEWGWGDSLRGAVEVVYCRCTK